MDKKDCTGGNNYLLNGTCCLRCPAGKYIHRVCDSTTETECLECGRELYTATANHLTKCLQCTQCNTETQVVVKECLADQNRVCGCKQGFYCHDPSCEHCEKVTACPPGEGVKVKATVTNDTICEPCESGTFSNVSDRASPCQTHTSCEEQGRGLEKHGTLTTDAICSPFKRGGAWELPAGLWSGLVLTTLLVFLGLLLWRRKRKSRKKGNVSILTDPLVVVGPPVGQLNPPAPPPLMDIHCQESCERPSHMTVEVLDSVVNGLHKTHPELNGNLNEDNHPDVRPCTLIKTSLCIHSEPQEDEWGGT